MLNNQALQEIFLGEQKEGRGDVACLKILTIHTIYVVSVFFCCDQLRKLFQFPTNSTRRFFARPSSEVFGATGQA